MVKKFIKEIIYSKDQIQINLYFSNNSENLNLACPEDEGRWAGNILEENSSLKNPQKIVRNIKIGSALKITANRPDNFTKFYSSGKRKKFKEITAQSQAWTSR
ncbi:MAG: hypothetical protein AB1567_04085 [bacterium]